ncbi:unnamed protein product [Protopolystoma xenopodis]|uniref:Uncharacterized protein n=1 Tax=Protopolystoma xenopodis TaxID=117903 RepID=A0A448X1K0_9PLAT|nr:unnamed protein product [Protopolystoma xenopodis]
MTLHSVPANDGRPMGYWPKLGEIMQHLDISTPCGCVAWSARLSLPPVPLEPACIVADCRVRVAVKRELLVTSCLQKKSCFQQSPARQQTSLFMLPP